MGKGFKCGSGMGISMVTLWENDASGSAYEAATVALDLTGFDLVAICYQFGTGADAQIRYFQVGKPGSTIGMEGFGNGTTVRRRTAVIADDGISFGAGYAGSNALAAAIIPVAIYGIRGVAA